MAKGKGKKGIAATSIALGLTIVIVGTILLLQNLNRPVVNQAPQTETTDSSQQEEVNAEDQPLVEEEPATDEVKKADPATLTSVKVEPMDIEVFYTKGTPGFEFAVKRTASGTKYVEFSSPDLVGTKCTNDEGVFVTIVESPSAEEDQATIAEKTTVGDTVYGLSLNDSTCTSDPDLLKTYQSAFKNGFSSLKGTE